MTTNVLQLADFREAAMFQFTRDQLALVCTDFDVGDPFNIDAMHAMVRWTFKTLAAWHERNAAPHGSLAFDLDPQRFPLCSDATAV